MSRSLRRPAKVMLLAAAVTGLIGVSAGLALADDLPAAQVEFCGSGFAGQGFLAGFNQRNESVNTDWVSFPASGCTKVEGYWWSGSPTVQFDMSQDSSLEGVIGTCWLGSFKPNDVVSCNAPSQLPPAKPGVGNGPIT